MCSFDVLQKLCKINRFFYLHKNTRYVCIVTVLLHWSQNVGVTVVHVVDRTRCHLRVPGVSVELRGLRRGGGWHDSDARRKWVRYCCSDRSLHAGVRTCQTMAAETLGRQLPCFSDPLPHARLPLFLCLLYVDLFPCVPFSVVCESSTTAALSVVTRQITWQQSALVVERVATATLCTVACWGCLLHSQLYVTDYCAMSNSLMLVSNFHKHHWRATTPTIIVSVALQLS